MNKHIIVFMWVTIFGFILYKRHTSDTIIVLCGSIITLYFYYDTTSKNTQNDEMGDIHPELLSWLDILTTTTNREEKDRCFNEIQNMLYSDGIKEQKYNHELIRTLIDQYKPTEPLALNIDNADQYAISVGFTKCQ